MALFLTVATVWLFLYANQTIRPEQTDPRDFLVLIGVVVPFVMLIYFGFAFLISDTISLRAPWLTLIGVAMVALAQSDSAAHEGTRRDNCDGDYRHNRWCYLGRTLRPHILKPGCLGGGF